MSVPLHKREVLVEVSLRRVRPSFVAFFRSVGSLVSQHGAECMRDSVCAGLTFDRHTPIRFVPTAHLFGCHCLVWLIVAVQ